MTCKVKISIITPSLNGGGAEKVTVNLSNYYASLGYSVDLVVFKLSGPYISLVAGNVNIVNLDVTRTRFVFFKIRKYLKNNKNSMVLSVIRDANIFVGFAGMGLKLKSLTFREANTLDSILKKNYIKILIYKILMKLSYRRADNIIANSDDTKMDIVMHNIVHSSKVSVIRNPVLDPLFEQLALENVNDEWFKQSQTKLILSVGRLHVQKNFSFLISVFKDIYFEDKSVRLIIVGEGDEEINLLAQIDKELLGEVVKIIKFQKNIFPYYANADIFALTSQWEGFGNVLVEALSMGLPVISTNCPGGPKMILENGRYGQLVPLGDKCAYKIALRNALKITEKSVNAKKYAKSFTVESVAAIYFEILDQKIHN